MTIFFVFRTENWTFLEESCYKVSLCENFQRQSCKAFIGLSICAQMVGGGCPLVAYLKFWINVTYPLLKRRFPVYIRS